MGLVFSISGNSQNNDKAVKTYIKEGNKLLNQHKLDKAEEAFQKAIDLDYRCLDAHIGKYCSTRDIDTKRLILNEFSGLYPDNLRVLGCKYNLELLLDNKEESDLINHQIISAKKPNTVGGWMVKYGAYVDINDDENALNMVNEALNLDKKNPYLHFKKATQIYDHNSKEALKHVNIALKLDPLFCDAWSLKGDIFGNMGKYKKSLAAYDKALEIDPNDLDTLHNKGVKYYDHDKYEESLELDLRILTIDPDNHDACSGAASAYHGLGDFDKALEYRNKSIELSPDNEFYYFSRGATYCSLGMNQEAHADFAKGYELFKAHGEKVGEHGEFVEYALSARDELIEEFNKLAQTKDLEIITSSESDTDEVKALNVNIVEVNTAKHELISKAAEVVNPLSKASDDILSAMQKQMALMMATIGSLTKELSELKATTVQRTEVKWAISINHSKEAMDANMAKIYKDVTASKYYEGFRFALNAAYASSVVIVNGQVATDTKNLSVSAVAFAVSFIPFVGNGVQTAVTSINDTIKSAHIKTAAATFSKIAPDVAECSELVLHIAMRVTLHPYKDAEIHRPDAPEKSQGFWSGLVAQFSAAREQVATLLEGDRYDSPAAKLGYRDASLLIKKIGNGEISTDKNGLEDRCCEALLGTSKHDIVLAGAGLAVDCEEESFGFDS